MAFYMHHIICCLSIAPSPGIYVLREGIKLINMVWLLQVGVIHFRISVINIIGMYALELSILTWNLPPVSVLFIIFPAVYHCGLVWIWLQDYCNHIHGNMHPMFICNCVLDYLWLLVQHNLYMSRLSTSDTSAIHAMIAHASMLTCKDALSFLWRKWKKHDYFPTPPCAYVGDDSHAVPIGLYIMVTWLEINLGVAVGEQGCYVR